MSNNLQWIGEGLLYNGAQIACVKPAVEKDPSTGLNRPIEGWHGALNNGSQIGGWYRHKKDAQDAVLSYVRAQVS